MKRLHRSELRHCFASFSLVLLTVQLLSYSRRDLGAHQRSVFQTHRGAPPKFHYILTKAPLRPRYVRAFESACYHHTGSEINIHLSPTVEEIREEVTESMWRLNHARKCDVQVRVANLETELRGFNSAQPRTAKSRRSVETFLGKLIAFQKTKHWAVHEADLLRLLILFREGGVYLDVDTIILQPIGSLVNVIGEESPGIVNNAVLMFDRHHPFLACAIDAFVQNYRNDKFSENGPVLLTKLVNNQLPLCSNIARTINVLGSSAFQPVHWSEMRERLRSGTMQFSRANYVFHYNSHAVNDFDDAKLSMLDTGSVPGSLLNQILNSFCIICEDQV